MKIKKKTGVLMVAAATAAVVGIASVSFAAWTGENTTLTASITTGEAHLVGFANGASISFSKELVPYDQPSGSYDATTASTFLSAAIPSYTVNQDYTITVEVSDIPEGKTMNFHALVGDSTSTIPATGAPADWTGWKKVNVTNGAAFDFTNTTANLNVTDKVLYLVMTSGEESDMGAEGITLTVTLAEKPVV